MPLVHNDAMEENLILHLFLRGSISSVGEEGVHIEPGFYLMRLSAIVKRYGDGGGIDQEDYWRDIGEIDAALDILARRICNCLLYTSPSPRDCS